jgi:hypothetical protein
MPVRLLCDIESNRAGRKITYQLSEQRKGRKILHSDKSEK